MHQRYLETRDDARCYVSSRNDSLRVNAISIISLIREAANQLTSGLTFRVLSVHDVS